MSKAWLDSVTECSPSSLPPELPTSTVSEITSWLVGHTLAAVERELILHTLTHCAGNRVWAASVLGIPVAALEEKIRGYASRGIAIPEKRNDEVESEDAHADEYRADEAQSADIDCEEKADLEDAPGQPAQSKGPQSAVLMPAEPRPASRRRNAENVGIRWLVGGVLATVAIISLGFRVVGGNNEATAALFGTASPPRIETAILERPLPLAPAAAARLSEPPRAAVEFSSMEMEQRRRMRPAPGVAAEAATAAATTQFSASVNIEHDTRMDSGPRPAVQAAKPTAAAKFSASVNIEHDTRMDPDLPGAVQVAAPAGPATFSASANVEHDTRMDREPPVLREAAVLPVLIDKGASKQDERAEGRARPAVVMTAEPAKSKEAAPAGLHAAALEPVRPKDDLMPLPAVAAVPAGDRAITEIPGAGSATEVKGAEERAMEQALALDSALIAIAAAVRVAESLQTEDNSTTAAAFIEPETTIELPQTAPLPLARRSPDERIRPVARAASRPQPEAKPENPFPLLFPFGNLFKGDKTGANGANATGIFPAGRIE